MAELIERLEHVGYARAGTVTDPGQYAVRGGILDFYPPGARPVRLDFFGDTLESIRAFDPETQRTLSRLDAITVGRGHPDVDNCQVGSFPRPPLRSDQRHLPLRRPPLRRHR